MDLKQFLIDNPLIKQAVLARMMYDNKPHSATMLANKLAGVKGQRITPKDEADAIEALKQLGVNISKLKVGD